MENSRELLAYQIMSGKIRCKTPHGLFYVKSVTPEEKYISEEIYTQTYNDSILDGAYSDDSFSVFLTEKNIWNPILQAKLDKLFVDLDNLKVSLYNSYFDTDARDKLKEMIYKTKQEIIALNNRLHSYDYISASGIAALQKGKFLTAMAIHDENEKKMFRSANYWMADTKILESISSIYSKSKPTEEDVRHIARTEPWRSVWHCRKTGNIFSCSIIELTDEQRHLIYWSQVYDNIHESQKCPSEDIICDDDALDGWFIIQNKERKQQTDKDWIESKITNPNIKNSGEIFIKTNKQDASRVYTANDLMGRAKQKALFKKINNEGVVEVNNQPDAIIHKAQELQRMYKEKIT